LLAAYRKYGLPAPGWVVEANHFCNSGAVADTTSRGRPAVNARKPNSQGMGFASTGTEPIIRCETVMGSTAAGSNIKPRCASAWYRDPIHRVDQCAYA